MASLFCHAEANSAKDKWTARVIRAASLEHLADARRSESVLPSRARRGAVADFEMTAPRQ
jgi:hypothetical protein